MDEEALHRNQEVVIDAMLSYKGRGWTAYCPNPRNPTPTTPAFVLIGSRADGWTRALTISGEGRFARGAELARRYNTAPAAAFTAGG